MELLKVLQRTNWGGYRKDLNMEAYSGNRVLFHTHGQITRILASWTEQWQATDDRSKIYGWLRLKEDFLVKLRNKLCITKNVWLIFGECRVIAVGVL